MTEKNVINQHMEIIGSDGVHVGVVDAVEGNRIKLTKASGDDGKHHYISTSTVQDIKGNTVTLTTTADVAISSEQEA